MVRHFPTRVRLAAALLCGALLALGGGPALAADAYFVTIATGSEVGVYHAAGAGICRLLNAARERHGVRCTVTSSSGSIHTIESLRHGEIEFGFVQSDWRDSAYTGSDMFASDGAFEPLRTVLTLHREPLTIVARVDSGIKQFDDLRGRRVNIGNPGSGHRATIERMLRLLGWSLSDFALVAEYGPAAQSRALCDGAIEATLYIVGHPNDVTNHAAETCNVVVVPVGERTIDRLLGEAKGYAPTTIPGALYRGNPNAVSTVAVQAALVSTTAVSDTVVEILVSTVMDNLAAFKRSHTALGALEAGDMVEADSAVPLHPGVERYRRGTAVSAKPGRGARSRSDIGAGLP